MNSKKIGSIIRLLALTLVVAAVAQELRKPPAERTWHGRLGGVIPYDFNCPTWGRLREAYWNPNYPHVFTDRVLGVGWGINIPIVFNRLRKMCQTRACKAE